MSSLGLRGANSDACGMGSMKIKLPSGIPKLLSSSLAESLTLGTQLRGYMSLSIEYKVVQCRFLICTVSELSGLNI